MLARDQRIQPVDRFDMGYMKAILHLCTIVLWSNGCAYAGHNSKSLPLICSIDKTKRYSFVKLDILVSSDQHGSSASIKLCKYKTLSIDFSESDLFSDKNAALLNEVRRRSVLGGSPIEMTVSGTLNPKSEDDLRDTILVSAIVSYKIDRAL